MSIVDMAYWKGFWGGIVLQRAMKHFHKILFCESYEDFEILHIAWMRYLDQSITYQAHNMKAYASNTTVIAEILRTSMSELLTFPKFRVSDKMSVSHSTGIIQVGILRTDI